MHQQNAVDFIPADESRWFTWLFTPFCRVLFRVGFRQVWLRQLYHPEPGVKTVYFLNHSSWWDGIIPLMLNQYRFRQQGRALMEHKQMRRYPFFKKIGAFSVDPKESRSAVASMRYALRSMQRPSASLFIYPEGEIVPFSTTGLQFKQGIGWLWEQLPEADFVPIAISVHTIRSPWPELHIRVGKPVPREKSSSMVSATERLAEALQKELRELVSTAGFRDEPYEKWL
ncbi:MAG: lysophospholipid acyltransferase family protein [Balneolaceae bacterium]